MAMNKCAIPEMDETVALTFGPLEHALPVTREEEAAWERLAARAKVGDVNSNARGSGARYNQGKADLSLIPLPTLEDEARVWMYGEAKYKRFNWMKGMNWSIPMACALRHLAAWQSGEDMDPESGQPHLAHAMCNLRMLTLYAHTFPEGDDRPKEWMP